jgi:hypothetical protein
MAMTRKSEARPWTTPSADILPQDDESQGISGVMTEQHTGSLGEEEEQAAMDAWTWRLGHRRLRSLLWLRFQGLSVNNSIFSKISAEHRN